ncbi:cytochrome P450 [Spirillospora sp. CA-255316]
MSNTGSVTEVTWDPFNAPKDPYPTYAAMREHAPAYHNAEVDVWAFSRFADVQAANRDWRTFSYAKGTVLDGIGDFLQPGNFLDHDPPLHSQLRAVVKDKFSVSALRESLSSVIADEVDQLLVGTSDADEFDFGLECAWVLPVVAACHLMGFAREDIDRLRGIADNAFAVKPGPPGSGEASAAGIATAAVRAYFEEQIEDRRRHPKDDLLTHIATATVDGQPIGDSAAGIAALIFAGSADTTALTLTNLVNLLAEHPEQREWLVKNPDKTEQAVEEVLRYESPIQLMKRHTTREVEVHGRVIPAGANVCLIFASANRDSRQFDRPDEFDVRRKFSRHIAFGDGVHHCIGAPLARMEATTMLRRFLELVPNYEIGESQKIAGTLRGFRTLQIKRK